MNKEEFIAHLKALPTNRFTISGGGHPDTHYCRITMKGCPYESCDNCMIPYVDKTPAYEETKEVEQ